MAPYFVFLKEVLILESWENVIFAPLIWPAHTYATIY